MLSFLMLACHASGSLQKPGTELVAPAAPDVSPASDLPAMAPERRRTAGHVKPAWRVEWPYISSVGYGRAFNINNKQFLGHAFKPYQGKTKREETSQGTIYDTEVIKSTSTFNEAMRATATVSGSGWGVTAKADASASRQITMTSDQAIFLLHARTDLGFEGWNFNEVPPLTDSAKAALCHQGKFTPERFEEIYGTHYVLGVRKATVLDVVLKVTTKSSNAENKVSASLEASWQGFSAGASGSASFAAEFARETSDMTIDAEAYAFGVDVNWVPEVSADTIGTLIDEYQQVSTRGSAIAHVMQRYNEHDDYLKVQGECGSTFQSLERDEYFEDMLVDVAVEARLLAEELLESDIPCAQRVVSDAYELFDTILLTTEENVGFAAFNAKRKKMREIRQQWEDCEASSAIKCSVSYSEAFQGRQGRACPAELPVCLGWVRNVGWGQCGSTGCTVSYYESTRGVPGKACPRSTPVCEGAVPSSNRGPSQPPQCVRKPAMACSVGYKESRRGVKGTACPEAFPVCVGAVKNVQWGQCV